MKHYIASCLFAWVLACNKIMSFKLHQSVQFELIFLIFFPLIRGPPPVSNHFLMHWSRVVTYEGVDRIYFLFFRTAQENAKRHFPDNVECKTLHSLAFKKVASRLVHKGLIFPCLSLLALCVCFCGLSLFVYPDSILYKISQSFETQY